MTVFRYVSDKYGNEPFETTPEKFEEMVFDIWPDCELELHWRYDPEDGEYYVDQDDEVVLREVKGEQHDGQES